MDRNIYFYMAGPIEHSDHILEADWKAKILSGVSIYKNVVAYNPVERESSKTGKESKANCDYMRLLKSKGKFNRLNNMLDKIWWGDFDTKNLDRLVDISCDAEIGAITKTEFYNFGDFPAVAASDFIIAHLPQGTKTVGTFAEITLAYLLHKPIFVLCPGQDIVDINSTLIYFSNSSGGGIFKSTDDLVSALTNHINLITGE